MFPFFFFFLDAICFIRIEFHVKIGEKDKARVLHPSFSLNSLLFFIKYFQEFLAEGCLNLYLGVLGK